MAEQVIHPLCAEIPPLNIETERRGALFEVPWRTNPLNLLPL